MLIPNITFVSYIKLKNVDKMRQFFPQMQMVDLDAGHWGEHLTPISYKTTIKTGCFGTSTC